LHKCSLPSRILNEQVHRQCYWKYRYQCATISNDTEPQNEVETQPTARLPLGDRTNDLCAPPPLIETPMTSIPVVSTLSVNETDDNMDHAVSSAMEILSSAVLSLDHHRMNEERLSVDSNWDSSLENSWWMATTYQQVAQAGEVASQSDS
jgi:hypothetical protein